MTKPIQTIRAGRLDQVPPWCFMKPGMTPMEGAKAAIRALSITHPLDVLLTLWALQGGMAPGTSARRFDHEGGG